MEYIKVSDKTAAKFEKSVFFRKIILKILLIFQCNFFKDNHLFIYSDILYLTLINLKNNIFNIFVNRRSQLNLKNLLSYFELMIANT